MNISIATSPQDVFNSDLGWDVEAELQKELDAVSMHSDMSSPSISSCCDKEMEEVNSAEDCENTSFPLKRLLDEWHNKEEKFNIFETMLKKIHRWQSDGSHMNNKEQSKYSQVSAACPKALNEMHNAGHCILSQQEMQRQRLSLDVGTSIVVKAGTFVDHTSRADLSQCENLQDISCSSILGENHDKLSCQEYNGKLCNDMCKKKVNLADNIQSLAAEPAKNIPNQINMNRLRMTNMATLEGQQELEQDTLKRKLTLLEHEHATQKQWLEALQIGEEIELEVQQKEMEQSFKFLSTSACSFKTLEDELELKRLAHSKDLNISIDHEIYAKEFVQVTNTAQIEKCCILIQARVRGFLCRKFIREFASKNEMKHGNSVSSLKTCDLRISKEHKSYLTQAPYQNYSSRPSKFLPNVNAWDLEEKQDAMQDVKKLEAKVSGVDLDHTWSSEEILSSISHSVKFGSMEELQSLLELALSLGFDIEVSCAEAQLAEKQEGICTWLGQVIQGWEVKKSRIQEVLLEARRLQLHSSCNAVENIIVGREKEIKLNLEASVLKGSCLGSRSGYNYWLSKAKVFGIGEEHMAACARHFHQKCETVQTNLNREARFGSKRTYSSLLKDAASLELESDIRAALKTLLKRTLQVFKEGVVLQRPMLANNVEKKPYDQNGLGMEWADLGLDSQTLSELREKVSEGKYLENLMQAWTSTVNMDVIGVSYTIMSDKCYFMQPGVEIGNASQSILVGNYDEASSSSDGTYSSMSRCTSSLFVENLWVLNWIEINSLQLRWQKSMEGYPLIKEHTCLSNPCSRNCYKEQHQCLQASKNYKEVALKAHSTCFCEHREMMTELENKCILHNCTNKTKEVHDSATLSDSEDDASRHEICPCTNAVLNDPEILLQKSVLTGKLIAEKMNCREADLQKLVMLDLTDTHLKSLGKTSLFKSCPQLRLIIFDMNEITNFGSALRDGKGCLKQLSARDNLLQDTNGLEDYHYLEVLHLDGNSISKIGLSTDNCDLKLRKTGRKEQKNHTNKNGKVYTNFVKKSQDLTLCWPRLRVLTVGCNQLTNVLSLGSLCPNVEVLDLGSNQIASLESADENALAGLAFLRFLDVGQNQLKGKSLWKGLENCPGLVSLVASRNKLQELPNHFGSVLLREIWLNGNAIKHLACNAWLPSLQRLYLQDNVIDTLESMWGCPSLEVLDLSFNNISDLAYLHHLSCFPNLKSLQLNDNPVSEGDEHIYYILQAVPWLVELDNEAIPKALMEYTLTRTLKKIMSAIGLDFLKEKIAGGEISLPGIVCRPMAHSYQNVQLSKHHQTRLLDINNILNCEVGEEMQLKLLIAVKRWINSSSDIQNSAFPILDSINFEGIRKLSKKELEAKEHVNAYQQMNQRLKGRLHSATKERCMGKPPQRVTNSSQLDSLYDVNVATTNSDPHLKHATGEIDLEGCLGEHLTFDPNSFGEYVIHNKEYELELNTQRERAVVVQAHIRGFLTRKWVNSLRQTSAAKTLEQQRRSTLRIQTWWRGWRFRRAKVLETIQLQQWHACLRIQAHWRGYHIRFKLKEALAAAKYVDDDDFDYAFIDNNEFLEGEKAFLSMFEPILSLRSTIKKIDLLQMQQNSDSKPSTMVEDLEQQYSKAIDTNIRDLECDPKHCKHKAEQCLKLKEIQTTHSQNPLGRSNSLHQQKKTTAKLKPTLWADRNVQENSAGDLDKPSRMPANEAEIEGEILARLLKNESCIQSKAGGGDSRVPNIKGNSAALASIDKEFKQLLENMKIDVNAGVNDPINNTPSNKRQNAKMESTLGRDAVQVEDNTVLQNNFEGQTTFSLAEIRKKEEIEELAKDWGLKNERTAQALCKARKRINQQAKEAAHRTLLQDPGLRLQRFKEKILGQVDPQTAPPTKQKDQRVSFDHGKLGGNPLSMLTSKHCQEHKCKGGLEDKQYKQESENFLNKLDSTSPRLQLSKLLQLQRQQLSSIPETKVLQDKTRQKPLKALRKELLALSLPRVILDPTLPTPPFKNQRAVVK